MAEDLAEHARQRALRLMAQTMLKAASDARVADGGKCRLSDTALDVLLELRAGPIGPDRAVELQQLLATVTIEELGD